MNNTTNNNNHNSSSVPPSIITNKSSSGCNNNPPHHNVNSNKNECNNSLIYPQSADSASSPITSDRETHLRSKEEFLGEQNEREKTFTQSHQPSAQAKHSRQIQRCRQEQQ